MFGYQHVMVDGLMTHDLANPNGPSALMYAWMGPFIGALIRPIGGWIADKMGGAKVTQYCLHRDDRLCPGCGLLSAAGLPVSHAGRVFRTLF